MGGNGAACRKESAMSWQEILKAHRNVMKEQPRNDTDNKVVCLQITVAEILKGLIARDLREMQELGESEANVRKWIQTKVLHMQDMPGEED